MHASPFARPRFIPPHMMLILVVALLLGARFAPEPRWVQMPWNLLGLLPLVLGLVFAASASRLFARKGTAIRPLEPSSALVEDGPFRWSRNPMYTGLTALLLGLAVLVGNAVSFFAPVFFAVWVRWAFIRREEIYMLQQFGNAYRDYCSRVRRWI